MKWREIMKIYNTKTRKIEDFIPYDSKEIKMYTCGPTVYHYAHIGNLRSYIMEDVLEKTLRFLGYNVKRVMNITDVGHLSSDADTGEDKMVKGAIRENKTVMEIAKFYEQAFFNDFTDLTGHRNITGDKRRFSHIYLKLRSPAVQALYVDGARHGFDVKFFLSNISLIHEILGKNTHTISTDSRFASVCIKNTHTQLAFNLYRPV